MLLVAGALAAIWGIGRIMGAPRRGLVALTLGLWAALMLGHLLLPADHVLRRATGGDARVWLVLGAVAVLVLGYRAGLAALRRRAVRGVPQQQPVAAAPAGPFQPGELDRYARHILLHDIGGPGQRRLKSARVLVVGAGGLGSPALLYLAASGVGVIGVIDPDRVELSNLQRQIIHADDRIGMAKVASAAQAMRALNPFVTVIALQQRLDATNAAAVMADYDLILDGCDNFDTRYLVNRVAVALGKPLISAAIAQWEGQISLYHPAGGGPCFECVFPQRPAPGMVLACAEAGVAAPLPGVMGAMMAMEAVKHLTGAGEGLRGRLLIHDALHAETRVITARRRADCACCSAANGAS